MKINSVNSLNGEFTVDGDRSISHRAIMLGALANGKTTISGFLSGADCLLAVSCFEKLGVKVQIKGNDVCVHGNGMRGLLPPTEVLDVGNSGTTLRLLAGILAAQRFTSVIDCDNSIRNRPMGHIKQALGMMGAKIDGEACPIKIFGAKLNGINYTLPEASAQLKSAIVLASLFSDDASTIREPIPCRNHTELMLKYMGAPINRIGNEILIHPCERLNGVSIDIPGDISSAAFFIVGACITKNSDITIKNVGINHTRSGIIDVLVDMGANISIINTKYFASEPVCDIRVRSSSLKGIKISGSIIPRLIDELPVIAVAAAYASGETVIEDASQLKVKESNRIDSIAEELEKAGAYVKKTEDRITICCASTVKGANFCSHGDHRIAMSMAILALAADGDSSIDEPNMVDISFPKFFELIKLLSK